MEKLIAISTNLLLIYLLLDSMKQLYDRNFFLDVGAHDYSKNENFYTFSLTRHWVLQGLDAYLFSYRGVCRLLALRLAIVFLLFFHLISAKFLAVLLILRLLLYLRHLLAFNAADKFSVVILLGLSNFYLFDDLFIKEMSIYFIATMTVMAYFFTAYYKLQSALWRNSVALKIVLNTEKYGNKKFYYFLKQNPFFNAVICRGVIFIQLFFFLSFLSPKLCVFFLLGGFLFHFSTVMLMNLNSFFWVFIATYPCIYYVSTKLSLF